MLEAILKLLVFKVCYYIETGLCWLIGILMELFEVFAGLEPVTYNGRQSYLINVFFSNKAISNVYWGMAVIGMVLIFVFAGWAVIRKMFDVDGKQQQSMGQIIWSAIRSLFLIVGLTLVVNVVISATSILMRQVDYIFNNAYHLDQPRERDFTDEEYAAMGRILATIGNYSMIPNANNRYNINLCFNDIRSDMLFLQNQGVFRYSYYEKQDGVVVESWQSVLSKIAKSANLTQDLKIDVYNDSVASAITAAMDYLRSNGKPVPVEHIVASYTVTERAHLDRMVFLLGTMRAAKNDAYNEHPGFDDPLRGPYYYAQDRSIYNYDQVDEDFDIGFKTDYILVWLAAVALIFNLVIIILNCVARIFNLMLLYIIAPPFIASSPLDNGGKFKQWTTAFIIQSLSVFGTVIAMQLLLLYLPIVCSPELVLFKDRPLLNVIAQFMLVFGGIEAAKKAGSLVTGILADQAGMEAIRSGDMSGAANRMVNSAAGVAKGALGVAAGVAGFALAPVTNTIKRPFKAAGDYWRKLGTGGSQNRAEKSLKDEIARNKAAEKMRQSGHPDAKYLNGGSGGGSNPSSTPPPSSTPTPSSTPSQNNPNNDTTPKPPPPVPRGKPAQAGRSFDSNDAGRPAPKKGGSMDNLRQQAGFDQPSAAPAPAREHSGGSNRPTLDSEPRQAPANNNPANRPEVQNRGGNRRGGGGQGGGGGGGGQGGGGGGGGAASQRRRALSQTSARRGNENTAPRKSNGTNNRSLNNQAPQNNAPERRRDAPPERNRQGNERQNRFDRPQGGQVNNLRRVDPRDDRPRNDLPNNDRGNDLPQNDRLNDDRGNDVPQNDRMGNDRQNDVPGNDRRNELPRNERINNEQQNDIPGNDRGNEVPRNDRINNDRGNELPRNDRRNIERQNEVPRNDRRNDLPRNDQGNVPRQNVPNNNLNDNSGQRPAAVPPQIPRQPRRGRFNDLPDNRHDRRQ